MSIHTCSFTACFCSDACYRILFAYLRSSCQDPTRPGVGERETAFDYPLLRGVAMAAPGRHTRGSGLRLRARSAGEKGMLIVPCLSHVGAKTSWWLHLEGLFYLAVSSRPTLDCSCAIFELHIEGTPILSLWPTSCPTVLESSACDNH